METKLEREWLKTVSSCISDDNQRSHPEVTAALQQFKFVAARLAQTKSDTPNCSQQPELNVQLNAYIWTLSRPAEATVHQGYTTGGSRQSATK